MVAARSLGLLNGLASGRRAIFTAGLHAAAECTGLVPAFQPIVSLPDGATVGFEALARWPALPWCTPDRVFAHARAIGDIATLDQLCIDAALATALRSPLGRGALLCLNTEPSTPYAGRAENALVELGSDELTVMFEITERSVLAHPQSLLRKVDAIRADGFTIALDDVGAHPDSISLLDVILPDVIKLDLALVQNQPSNGQARTLNAVLAHHERTNAVILAEGIETDEHVEQALAVGATLGQGFLFGCPGPLGQQTTGTWSAPAQAQTYGSGMASLFDLVAETTTVRTARKETLIALSRDMEAQAMRASGPPMVFTALQRNEFFSGVTMDRYRDLASTCSIVAVFGQGMPADLGPGVRGVALKPGDPLGAEWTFTSLGPHNATTLIARERHDDHDSARLDGDGRFDFVLTYDRALVTAVVRGLLDRMP